MKLAPLTFTAHGSLALDNFRGLDRRPNAKLGALQRTRNTSSAHSPLLTVRTPRTALMNIGEPLGLCSHEKLLFIGASDTAVTLYGDGTPVATDIPLTRTQKTMVPLGRRVFILPDGVTFDTATAEMAYAACAAEAAGITLTPCTAEGLPLGDITCSADVPQSPAHGSLWLDTGGTAPALKQYDEEQGAYIALSTAFVRLTAPGLGRGFRAGDGVTIRGFTGPRSDLNGAVIIEQAAEDSILIPALLTEALCSGAPAEETVTLRRSLPELDLIAEHNNRLWGCCSADHTIRACALGDPTNWERYAGTAADSYAVTVGAPGPFTGCISFLGYLWFFQENGVHRLSGTRPANFTLTHLPLPGPCPGAAPTLCGDGSLLTWLSACGPVCFDGTTWSLLGEALQLPPSDSALAAMTENTLYLCTDRGEHGALYTLRLPSRRWNEEDPLPLLWLTPHNSGLYGLTKDGDLVLLSGPLPPWAEDSAAEGPIRWMAETAPIFLSDTRTARITGVTVQGSLEAGATLTLLVNDGSGPGARRALQWAGPEEFTVFAPFYGMPCSRCTLLLEGTGPAVIHSLKLRLK